MAFENIFEWLRLAHIVGGSIALLSGYAALLVKRGGPGHRRFGRWYVYAMAIVALTGAPMSIIRPNPFLFGIVMFSSYFVYSGFSLALNRSGRISVLDKTAANVLLVGSLVALSAIGYVAANDIAYNSTFLITGAVFAMIGIVISVGDLHRFRQGAITRQDRIVKHLISMCAGLIATTTAVAVTVLGSFPAVPPLISWLGPTVVITPIIFYWVRQLRTGTFHY